MKRISILLLIAATTSWGQTLPPYLPAQGLLGWWPFNSNANDESGFLNHGTATGATLTADRHGSANSAYYFNGSSWIRTSFTTATVTNNFTMALWSLPQDTIIMHSVGSYTDRISIGKGAAFHPTHGAVFSTSNASGAGIYVGTNGITVFEHSHNYLRCALSYPVALSGWHSVVVVYTNKQPTLYLDGLPVATGQAASNNVYLSFGYDNNTLGDYSGSGFGSAFSSPTVSRSKYKGNLDDIGLWNRSLTPLEIFDMVFPCQDSITRQPINIICTPSQTHASFTCSSSNPNATYQWQQNSGLGWINLSNFGVYQGTTTDSLSITGISSALNNYAFRCIINGCQADTTNFALLQVSPCLDSIVQQPIDFTASYSIGWANFKCKSSNTTAQYQWQEHNGTSWQNLTSGGIYLGATSDSLVLSGLTASMQNYGYRCIITTCATAVSDSANLEINDVIGLHENGVPTIYPNPTTGIVHIPAFGVQSWLIKDLYGRVVLHGSSGDPVDLNDLSPGVYFFGILMNSGYTEQKLVKI